MKVSVMEEQVITSIGISDYLTAMAIQKDGKILVTGTKEDDENDNESAFIVRYLSNGQLDESFGSNGIDRLIFSGAIDVNAIKVQSDNKIILSGNYRLSNRLFVSRYLTEGTIDESFGGEGIATFYGVKSYNMTLQKDDKIISAGMGRASNNLDGMSLVRFNSNGIVDSTFGKDGMVVTSFGNRSAETKDLIVQSDGKIISSGDVYDADFHTNGDFAIARYASDGNLDQSFGTNGIQTAVIEGNANNVGIVLQTDGKLVTGGDTYTTAPSGSHFVLTRYKGDEIEKNIYVKIKHWLHHHGFTWEDKPGNDISY